MIELIPIKRMHRRLRGTNMRYKYLGRECKLDECISPMWDCLEEYEMVLWWSL